MIGPHTGVRRGRSCPAAAYRRAVATSYQEIGDRLAGPALAVVTAR
ncbi:MAG: hypothetical protein ABR499_08790 [Gemmatimonadaceae bacterium]